MLTVISSQRAAPNLRVLEDQIGENPVTAADSAAAAENHKLGLQFSVSTVSSLWRRVWPLAGLAAAVLVNVLWLGALGYTVARLL